MVQSHERTLLTGQTSESQRNELDHYYTPAVGDRTALAGDRLDGKGYLELPLVPQALMASLTSLGAVRQRVICRVLL